MITKVTSRYDTQVGVFRALLVNWTARNASLSSSDSVRIYPITPTSFAVIRTTKF